jgi:hypothetical protein
MITPLLARLAVVLPVLATSGRAAALEATVQADRATTSLGQSVVVTVRVRGCADVPLLQPPASTDFSIGPLARSQPRPSSVPPGASKSMPSHPVGKGVAESIRELSVRVDRGTSRLPGGSIQEFRTARDALGGGSPSEHVFTCHVQPLRSGVLTLPGFAASAGGQTAISPPLTLTVLEPPVPNPAPARLLPSNPRPQADEPVRRCADAESGPDTARARHPSAAWIGVSLTGVLAGVVAGWSLQRRRRFASSPQPSARAELAEALDRLRGPARSAAPIREVVQDFLRRRFQLPPGEITPHEAVEHLRKAGVGEGSIRGCAELLESCTAVEFAPGLRSPGVAELAAEAERVLRRIMLCARTG